MQEKVAFDKQMNSLSLNKNKSTYSPTKYNKYSKNSPPVGLRNIGNTCFMYCISSNFNRNSILQCILASPYLTDFFLNDYKKSPSIRSQRLSLSFYELLLECKNGSSSTVTPSDLKHAVAKVAPQFTGYGQQDA